MMGGDGARKGDGEDLPFDLTGRVPAPAGDPASDRKQRGSPAPSLTAQDVDTIVGERLKPVIDRLAESEKSVAGTVREAVRSIPEAGGTPDSGVADRLTEIAQDVAERVAAVSDSGEAVQAFEKQVRLFRTDVERARKVQRRSAALAAALVMLVAGPLLFGLGLAVQQQLSLLPVVDPTGGWRSYVWSRYGDTIVGCERRAREANVVLRCEIAVDGRK